MNKLLSITLSATLLIAVATTIFVSCKKDMHEIAQGNSQITEKTEAQQVYEKIIKFRDARESYHSEAKTDNGYVSPSEARSILDGVINYEFSDVNRHLEEARLDTICYEVPAINGEGNVAVNDLIDIYDDFAAKIKNDINHVNYFMIIYPQNDIRDSDIKIVFTRGADLPDPPSIPYLDYFGENDNWIWGLGNGNCAQTIDSGDASTKLTEKCYSLLHNNLTKDDIDTSSLNTHIYHIDHEIKTYDSLQSYVNGVDYWLFHAENVMDDNVSTYCINYNYLNIYLQNLYFAVVMNNGCYHYSSRYHSPIRVININYGDNLVDDLDNHNYYNIFHVADLTYYKIYYPNE